MNDDKKSTISNNKNDDELFEALFAQAVIKSFENELAAIPPREELEKMYTFSDRHNAIMERAFKIDRRRDRRKKVILWGRRAVAALVISVTVLSGALMFVPTVRAAVADVLVQWFEQFTKYSSNPEIEDVISLSAWEPTYLPDGFAKAEQITLDGTNQVFYSNSSGQEIMLTYIEGVGVISVNNERVSYRTETYNSVTYEIFESQENGTENSVLWVVQGYSFLLNAEYSVDELIKIAQSMERK